MQEGVIALLAAAGIHVRVGARAYRPNLSLPRFETKLLKPQTIVEMLQLGSRDVGFAGADWVAELDGGIVEVLDTGLDPVRLVAAAPASLVGPDGWLPDRPLVVASEYGRLTRGWIESRALRATFVYSHGATEVFPPEDADCIVDITATGSTLEAHGLRVIDELMSSSTRLYASAQAMRDARKREVIGHLALLVRSVCEARSRVVIEVNVSAELLEQVVQVLPCMREPTIAPLHGTAGYAVKAAVPRAELPSIIPLIKARGGTDILVSSPSQIVP